MSVAELIEQIKALPPAELEKVRRFLLKDDPKSGASVQYATDEVFNQSAERVFEKHDELLRKLAQ